MKRVEVLEHSTERVVKMEEQNKEIKDALESSQKSASEVESILATHVKPIKEKLNCFEKSLVVAKKEITNLQTSSSDISSSKLTAIQQELQLYKTKTSEHLDNLENVLFMHKP